MERIGVNGITRIAEDLLRDGVDVSINTFGSSMFPLISTGDKVTISRTEVLKIGDMIVFKTGRNDRMTCHRLVRSYKNDGTLFFQTRGDSFFSLDDPVTAEQVLGKVVKIERRNVSFLRKILLLLYPALKPGRVNAFVITALMKIRNCFPPKGPA